MSNIKKTAREIKISDKLLSNNNLNIKVGTVENRDCPDTIYIFVSFWLEPTEKYKNEDQEKLRNILDSELNKIYTKDLKKDLQKNKYFPLEKENIFIKNIPDNFNYNNKKNYISVELYLHTININNEKKLPISSKKNTELFDEAVKISNKIANSEVLTKSKYFNIYKKSN